MFNVKSLKYLQQEYSNLAKYASTLLQGIFVIPSDSAESWNGVIFVHSGKYQYGIFKFKMTFPSNYPFSCPKIQFLQTNVCHPRVNEDNELPLDIIYKSLKPMKHNISLYCLLYLKSIFANKNIFFNDDAQMIADCVKESQDNLFIPDENCLQFDKDQLHL